MTAQEYKVEILSKWRRCFTSDEIMAMAVELQSLIDLSVKESQELLQTVIDCPYTVDPATIPKAGVEAAPEQV